MSAVFEYVWMRVRVCVSAFVQIDVLRTIIFKTPSTYMNSATSLYCCYRETVMKFNEIFQACTFSQMPAVPGNGRPRYTGITTSARLHVSAVSKPSN